MGHVGKGGCVSASLRSVRRAQISPLVGRSAVCTTPPPATHHTRPRTHANNAHGHSASSSLPDRSEAGGGRWDPVHPFPSRVHLGGSSKERGGRARRPALGECDLRSEASVLAACLRAARHTIHRGVDRSQRWGGASYTPPRLNNERKGAQENARSPEPLHPRQKERRPPSARRPMC